MPRFEEILIVFDTQNKFLFIFKLTYAFVTNTVHCHLN